MTIEATKSLSEFETELAAMNMGGQWQADPWLESVIGGPKPAGVPYVWRWRDVYPKLIEACEVMQASFTARRNLTFRNPGLPGRGGATHTIGGGIQIIKPGEIAWAHRHTLNALRFVINGHADVYTAVDGEACPMESNDLILTPQWTWHDHHNPTADRAIWLDVLDSGIVTALNVPFYEPFGEDRQPMRTRRSDYIQDRAGALRPVWERPKVSDVPVRYPWSHIEPRLMEFAEEPGSPYDGVALEYVHPKTGGPTFPTMSCWVQLLRPGLETKPHRHTSSALYFVVRGDGVTVVGDQELAWSEHDVFALPNWAWHHHRNRSRSTSAILFSVTDIPALQAFGFYREEPEMSLQAFEPPAVPGNISRRRL